MFQLGQKVHWKADFYPAEISEAMLVENMGHDTSYEVVGLTKNKDSDDVVVVNVGGERVRCVAKYMELAQ